MLSILSLSACPSPEMAPENRPVRELAAADGVAAADLDGDGTDDPILVTGGVASWLGRTAEVGGLVQASARQTSGDREVLWLATGAGREAREATQRVWKITDTAAELVWERSTQRSQVPQLRVTGDRLWMAAFKDQKRVEGGWLVDGQFAGDLAESLATVQLPLSDDEVLVGRIYGDRPKSDGDLRLMSRNATPKTLPTRRGIQSLEKVDLDGDGHDELLVGDGWHYAYGEHAVARVKVLHGPDWTEGRVIGAFDDDYTVRAIHVIEGKVLAVGTSSVHLLERDELGWKDTVVTSLGESDWAVPFRDGGWNVLVSGDPARVVPLPGM